MVSHWIPWSHMTPCHVKWNHMTFHCIKSHHMTSWHVIWFVVRSFHCYISHHMITHHIARNYQNNCKIETKNLSCDAHENEWSDLKTCRITSYHIASNPIIWLPKHKKPPRFISVIQLVQVLYLVQSQIDYRSVFLPVSFWYEYKIHYLLTLWSHNS